MAGRNKIHNIGAFVDSEDEEQESPFSSPQKYYDLVSKSLHTYDKDMAEEARRTAERADATKRPQPRRRRPADTSLASDFEDGTNAEITPDEPVKPRLNRVLFRPRNEPKATVEKLRGEAAQDSDEDFTICIREREQSLDDLFVSQPPPDLISSDEHSPTAKPAEPSRARKALPTKSATKIPSGKIGSIRQRARDLKLSLFEAGLTNEDPAVSACTNLVNVLDTTGGNGGPRDSHSTGKRKRASITTSGRGSTSRWKVERRDQARLEAERPSKRKQGVSDEQFPDYVCSSQDSDDSDDGNEGVTIKRQKMIADRERRSEGAALKTAYPASQPQAKVPLSSRFEKPEELKKKMMPHPANNGTSLGRFDKHGGRSINKTVGGRKPQPAPSRSLLDRLTVTLDEDEDLPSVQELNGSGELRLNERNLHQQSRQARTINERIEDEASERMRRANTFVDDQVGHVEQDGYDSQALEIDSDSDLFGESADIGF